MDSPPAHDGRLHPASPSPAHDAASPSAAFDRDLLDLINWDDEPLGRPALDTPPAHGTLAAAPTSTPTAAPAGTSAAAEPAGAEAAPEALVLGPLESLLLAPTLSADVFLAPAHGHEEQLARAATPTNRLSDPAHAREPTPASLLHDLFGQDLWMHSEADPVSSQQPAQIPFNALTPDMRDLYNSLVRNMDAVPPHKTRVGVLRSEADAASSPAALLSDDEAPSGIDEYDGDGISRAEVDDLFREAIEACPETQIAIGLRQVGPPNWIEGGSNLFTVEQIELLKTQLMQNLQLCIQSYCVERTIGERTSRNCQFWESQLVRRPRFVSITVLPALA
nr:hypothetical protein HK105_000143 [Polyrhizophydium stewartii]